MEKRKEIKITINGRFASLNEYIEACRTNKNKANKMKRDAQNIIIGCVLEQIGKQKIHNKVILRYAYYEPNKKRDLDNISGWFHKVFQDALVQCGTIQNDNWYHIGGYEDRFDVDNKNPRIEVTITEVE